MGRTLNDILIDANAYLDLEAAAPTSTELATRTNYANQAIWDASATAQLKEFQKIYTVDPGTLASISLPNNFRELMGPVHQQLPSGKYDPFEEIYPSERFAKESGDKYVYILGNPAEGYTAVFNNLTANCTLSFDYQRFPSGLLTLTDVCELSDPTYVTSKVEAYVLESRNNERFPTKNAEAGVKLQNMIGRGMKAPGGGSSTIRRQGASAYSIGG